MGIIHTRRTLLLPRSAAILAVATTRQQVIRSHRKSRSWHWSHSRRFSSSGGEIDYRAHVVPGISSRSLPILPTIGRPSHCCGGGTRAGRSRVVRAALRPRDDVPGGAGVVGCAGPSAPPALMLGAVRAGAGRAGLLVVLGHAGVRSGASAFSGASRAVRTAGRRGPCGAAGGVSPRSACRSRGRDAGTWLHLQPFRPASDPDLELANGRRVVPAIPGSAGAGPEAVGPARAAPVPTSDSVFISANSRSGSRFRAGSIRSAACDRGICQSALRKRR